MLSKAELFDVLPLPPSRSVQMTPARMSPSPQTLCTLGPGLVLQLSTSEQLLPTSHSRCYHTAAQPQRETRALHAIWAMEAFCSTTTSPQTATFIKDDRGCSASTGSCGCYRATPALQEGNRGVCCRAGSDARHGLLCSATHTYSARKHLNMDVSPCRPRG